MLIVSHASSSVKLNLLYFLTFSIVLLHTAVLRHHRDWYGSLIRLLYHLGRVFNEQILHRDQRWPVPSPLRCVRSDLLWTKYVTNSLKLKTMY